MKRGFIIAFLVILLAEFSGKAQQVDIIASKKSLNKILIGLRDQYNLQFSFNDQLLSNYNLTVNRKFSSPEEAVKSLIEGLPLTFRKQGDIFMILPQKTGAVPLNYIVTGQITEAVTGEPLPYSHLLIDNRVVASDLKGTFSLMMQNDSVFHIKVSHLGYYQLDTMIVAGNNHRLNLVPSRIGLADIIVTDKLPDLSTQIGNRAGIMRINHQIARYLPGNADNSVFTLLRLMPGILASSEQSNGLIIWGAYEGHSQVFFDGFTLWGLKSFNDDIDAVNPLIAKDIEVLKGGYDAKLGDRVGGIVRISGKSGNLTKPSVSLNVNNVTVNGMAEVPLWRNSSLIMSFRQTYYNLYNNRKILPAVNQPVNSNNKRSKPNIDYTVFPDYNYRDVNVKFTARNDQGEHFYVSMLGGEDRFKSTINQVAGRSSLFKINTEHNGQYGASGFYGRTWNSGNISNFTAAWSSLETEVSDIQKFTGPNGRVFSNRDDQTRNRIAEYSGRIENFITLSPSHLLENGLGVITNDVGLRADSSGINLTDFSTQVTRLNAYLQDHITLPGEIDLKAGIRADFPFNLGKVYLQPRISTSIKATDDVKFNAAWGVYNQYISRSSVLDDQGNYRYIWTVCNNTDVPVLRAVHWVVGSSFYRNGLTMSIEGYYKHTEGITRFVNVNQRFKDLLYKGEGRSYGLDFFIKKDIRRHSAWISYTLSKTEEKFPYFLDSRFRPAPQDQRHELKAAVLFEVQPFNFSANYVYGSGFPLNNGTVLNPVYIEPDYNRLDVAVNWKFKMGKVAGETGISVLNVFDSKNIRYSNFERVPVDQTSTVNVYSEAVPFSPRISLRLLY